MSVPPVEVRATYDGSELSTGALQSADDIERLADSVDASADQMRASLASIDDGVNTTLSTGGTFSSGVDDVEAEGGRLKEVGSEVGAEFAANLQEGVASGDIKGSLLDTFSGLGAAAGATGQLGLAAAGVGVLLGATLMKGLSQAAAERRADFVDAVNSGFQELEIKASQSIEKIREQIDKLYTDQAVLEKLGGEEGLVGGYEKVLELTQTYGVELGDVLDLLRDGITPETQATADALKDASDNTRLFAGGVNIAGSGLTDTAKLAGEVLDTAEDIVVEQDALVELGTVFRDRTRETRDAMREAKEEAEALGEALGIAARNAANVVFDPNGTGS